MYNLHLVLCIHGSSVSAALHPRFNHLRSCGTIFTTEKTHIKGDLGSLNPCCSTVNCLFFWLLQDRFTSNSSQDPLQHPVQRYDSPLNLEPPHLSMLIQPLPFVRKNMLLSLFQEISLTSNLNCSSALERCVLASMNVTTSSLLPTAMVCPSGLQQILMFSPGNPDTISKILLAHNPPAVYLVIKERLELSLEFIH